MNSGSPTRIRILVFGKFQPIMKLEAGLICLQVTEPISSKGLDIVTNGHLLNRLENDGSIPRIRSGETLTTSFTTVRTPSNYPYQAWNY
jgi:hypothetical protein